MEYRRLGASGLEVSPLCVGTMTFGDRTDAAESRRIVDAAFAAGVNFIDTADVYGNGVAEGIVGPAIRANRRRWILATKVGNAMTAKPHDGGLSRRWVLAACDDSLARLGTDYIDIYYLHRDDPDTPIAETVGAIGDLIRGGKIRYFGVSNYRGWRIAEVVSECEAQGVPLPVVCQPYYNLLNRDTRSRDPARVRSLRHRRRALFADRARRADRQVPARRRARGFARGAQGRADDGDRVPRGVARDRADPAGARREDGPHADAVRAGVAVGERDRDVGDRRPAHARPVAGLRRRGRDEVERRRTRRSWIRW